MANNLRRGLFQGMGELQPVFFYHPGFRGTEGSTRLSPRSYEAWSGSLARLPEGNRVRSYGLRRVRVIYINTAYSSGIKIIKPASPAMPPKRRAPTDEKYEDYERHVQNALRAMRELTHDIANTDGLHRNTLRRWLSGYTSAHGLPPTHPANKVHPHGQSCFFGFHSDSEEVRGARSAEMTRHFTRMHSSRARDAVHSDDHTCRVHTYIHALE